MEYGSFEAKNVHNATINIDTLEIGNGNIEIKNMHNSTIQIGTLQLENLSIKGKNIHNSELIIGRLIPSANHYSSSVQLRIIENVRVNLKNIELRDGLDATRFLEQLMMR